MAPRLLVRVRPDDADWWTVLQTYPAGRRADVVRAALRIVLLSDPGSRQTPTAPSPGRPPAPAAASLFQDFDRP